MKAARIEHVIDLLDLNVCAETPVGNEAAGGISGGERKRLSIACELVKQPALLFADEPTTGLDATSALRVMTCLHRIASREHKAVVVTIHQPRARVLKLFGKLMVLHKGKSVYYGAAGPEMTAPFVDRGFPECGPCLPPAIITIYGRITLDSTPSLPACPLL